MCVEKSVASQCLHITKVLVGLLAKCRGEAVVGQNLSAHVAVALDMPQKQHVHDRTVSQLQCIPRVPRTRKGWTGLLVFGTRDDGLLQLGSCRTSPQVVLRVGLGPELFRSCPVRLWVVVDEDHCLFQPGDG